MKITAQDMLKHARETFVRPSTLPSKADWQASTMSQGFPQRNSAAVLAPAQATLPQTPKEPVRSGFSDAATANYETAQKANQYVEDLSSVRDMARMVQQQPHLRAQIDQHIVTMPAAQQAAFHTALGEAPHTGAPVQPTNQPTVTVPVQPRPQGVNPLKQVKQGSLVPDYTSVWSGLLEQLVKEGANEDFIAGMLKEAEGSDFLSKGIETFQPALDKVKQLVLDFANPVDDSGLFMDRHRILPFMSNRILGGLGGAAAGAAVANELGFDGVGKYLLPAVGSVAGGIHLPNVMNRWKDNYGEGLNKIHPGVADFNMAHPIIGESK